LSELIWYNMNKLTGISLVLLTVFIAACSGIKVVHDYDKSVDFSKYKTYEYYGWADNSDQILNQLDKDRIEKAFGMEFSKRGLMYVENNGDLIVTLYIVTQQKQQTTATTTGMGAGYGGYYGYGPGWGWGGGMATTTYNTYDYTVGTLVVDVYDKSNKQLIFEASGSGEINENPKNREKSIPNTVAQIMYSYPVKPMKEEVIK
jgi:hypothetical protein